jgi:hypothetical protein
LKKWTAIKSETLYWLSEGNYSDKNFVKSLAKEILKKQQVDGSWRVLDLNFIERYFYRNYWESAKTHATVLTIIALENYKNHFLS